uniref:Non-specific serine/threonine protein kinase n=1 Tax=Lotharella globosa TaxID=91324 RepID=A0A7S3ZDS9_9EUKA|mmetsp:Transcript_10605/g.20490  ORF Transcript_10605/g.20490 Transcript_10605/m.20490 type:complete len:1704 (+) Transcript_10605:81-5192(+)|eukprot:CAMPEP_0167777888 /NCGR_PEP_ID=MMETSP0111_2-20121227/3953_1 /TAXON_ID=91324 /ORGANISM="Lotharella globosa, Strain CCCM811" /LENGTH=1703 /DNA_ID=CAMNT_0007668141 /DNA_START=17 /DNA_END=5128 /DNA_ORIENTATION=+
MSEGARKLETKALQLVDRLTGLMVRDFKEDQSQVKKAAQDYSASCFDTAVMLREMLQCWSSKAFNQACRNSMNVRIARVNSVIKAAPAQKMLEQEMKVKIGVKGKWKHVVLSIEPGRMIMRDTHGGGLETFETDRILSTDLNNDDCRADFELYYGAENYIFRVANIMQRALWLHAIFRERQIYRIDTFVYEQSLKFRMDLLKAIAETSEKVKIDKELLHFLFADYSELIVNDMTERLKGQGVTGLLLEGSAEEPDTGLLSFQRIGIVACKWNLELELGGLKRLILTQHEPGGGQFGYTPEEVIGIQHVDEKRETNIRFRVQDRKTTISVDFPTDDAYMMNKVAMNWFCYDRPLRRFYHHKLLIHLLSIQFANSSSLENRNSVHWLIKIIQKSCILAANTRGGPIQGEVRHKHKLIDVLNDASHLLTFSEQDEQRRLQLLAHMLATGTIPAEEAKAFDADGKLHPQPDVERCRCSTGHCAIFLARIIEQVNGFELLEQLAQSRKIDTALWALKVLYFLCYMRKDFHKCLSIIPRRKANITLEQREGGHPFHYYIASMPRRNTLRVVATVFNIIVGRMSIDKHKKICELLTPEIRHPELVPFLFSLVGHRTDVAKLLLEKFANILVRSVDNARKITHYAGCLAWFFPFLIQEEPNEQEQDRRYILKLAIASIASLIAYDILGNPVREVYELQAWQCARILLRFTKWDEKGRNVLKMLLASAGLIIANKVKEYVKKHELDIPKMWKKIARFYWIYCEILLNMPARYALELGEFKVAVDKKGNSLDMDYLVRVIDIGEKIKSAIPEPDEVTSSKKMRNRSRFNAMVSFLHEVRQTMEKRTTIAGEQVAIFNRAFHKINRYSVTMSSMLTGSIKNPDCNIPNILAEYSITYFEEKSAAVRRTRTRTRTRNETTDPGDPSSSDEDRPPPPPPRSPQISVQAANGIVGQHEWNEAQRKDLMGSGTSVLSDQSEDKSSFLAKPDQGSHKKSISLDYGREVNAKTAQMFQKIIASLREKVDQLSAKDKKSQQDIFDLKAELRAFRDHRNQELMSPTPPPPPQKAQFLEACRRGDMLLIKKGITSDLIHELDGEGRGALHHAVFSFDETVLKLLVEAKASVNESDSDGKTALHIAAELGKPAMSMVEYLLKAGAKPKIKDLEGFNCVEAARNSSKAVIAIIEKPSQNEKKKGESVLIGSEPALDTKHQVTREKSMSSLSQSNASLTGAHKKTESVFDDGFWGAGSLAQTHQSNMSRIEETTARRDSDCGDEEEGKKVGRIQSLEMAQSSHTLNTQPEDRNVFDGGFWGESESDIHAKPGSRRGSVRTLPPLPKKEQKTVPEELAKEVEHYDSKHAPVAGSNDSNQKKISHQASPAPRAIANSERSLPPLPPASSMDPDPSRELPPLPQTDTKHKSEEVRSKAESVAGAVRTPDVAPRRLPPPPESKGEPEDETEKQIVPRKHSDRKTASNGVAVRSNAPAIPDFICREDAQTQAKGLLQCINSANIFVANFSTTMGKMQLVIEKSGDLHDAMLNVHMLRLLNVKYQKWEEFDGAIGSELVRAFRDTLLGPVREALPPGNEISKRDGRNILVMASQFGLGMLKNVAKYGVGSHPVPSIRDFFWKAKETFEKCDAKRKEEKTMAIQYLMSHSVFSKQVRVTNNDVDNLVVSVVYSKQGIQQGRTLVEALKLVAHTKGSLDSFRSLIDAVKAQCNE